MSDFTCNGRCAADHQNMTHDEWMMLPQAREFHERTGRCLGGKGHYECASIQRSHEGGEHTRCLRAECEAIRAAYPVNERLANQIGPMEEFPVSEWEPGPEQPPMVNIFATRPICGAHGHTAGGQIVHCTVPEGAEHTHHIGMDMNHVMVTWEVS